ncbi:TrmB family transcriptional regulator [Candidatus Bathyarchaeota archaeon]|nr:TrmB family transcriptional regulator [Candidatus Bathyarchaeota archaeon]
MRESTIAFEKDINQIKTILSRMGLNEYQASALAALILIGETKPTTLSKTSGVPSARIYGILEALAKMGLVTVRPGRPVLYRPRPPEDIASSLISLNMNELEEKLKILEDYAKDFKEIGEKVYLKGEIGVPTIPLLRIVRVGEVSLEETKKIYDTAKEEILILSKAMDYLPDVYENLKKAITKGVSIKIMLVKSNLLNPEDRKKQADTLEMVKELRSEVELRFSEEIPIRGCIIDPGKGGNALFLVEDPGVPFFLREAAITSHSSVVRGLGLMFSLMWDYKSKKF